MTEKRSWAPIEPLDECSGAVDFAEVDGLHRQWLDVKSRVESSDPDAYAKFNEELYREWAIETGIIEGLYELDRGITRTLIEHGFLGEYVERNSSNRPTDELLAILNGHRGSIDEIEAWIREGRALTSWFIKNLHQAIARSQTTYRAVDRLGRYFDAELHKGAFKTMPNNPTRPDGVVDEYAPPEQVDSEIDNLVDWYQSADDNHHSLAVGAWLHHRFTQIHPFEDGDGRVARALLTWHLVRRGFLPVVVTRDARSEYIEVLEKADAGNLSEFVEFIVKLETDTLLKALSVEHVQIPAVDTVGEVMEFIVDGLRRKRERQVEELRSVQETAIELRQHAGDILQEEVERVRRQLYDSVGLNVAYYPVLGGPDESNEHYFRREVVETARKAGHWINLQEPRYFMRISLRDSESSRSPVMVFVVSLHCVGRHRTGVMGATSFLKCYQSSEGVIEDQPDEQGDPEFHVCSPNPFLFTVSDNIDDLKPRFEAWVRRSFSVALLIWGESIIE